MSGFAYQAGSAGIDITDATEDGVRLAAEHVLQVARTRAPIEEGTLERSGKVSTETTGDGVRAAVSFDTPYAVRQHEEMDWRHDDGRQAKYLESALTGEADVIRAIVAEQLRAALR